MIKATGFMLVALLFAVLFGILGYFAGPQIEARGWPIARARTVADSVTRDDACVCWTTHFNKHREATPVLFDYRVTHRGRSIPVAAYKLDNGKRVYLTTYGFAYHPAGSEWDSRYCVDVPRDIARDDSFGLEGAGIYEVWHRLWQVPIPLPSFVVPGSAR